MKLKRYSDEGWKTVKKVKCGDMVSIGNFWIRPTFLEHSWEYQSKELRKCSNCRREELLFNLYYDTGICREDWRIKKLTK